MTTRPSLMGGMLRPMGASGLPFAAGWACQRFGPRRPPTASSSPLRVLSSSPGSTGWVIGLAAGVVGSVGAVVGVDAVGPPDAGGFEALAGGEAATAGDELGAEANGVGEEATIPPVEGVIGERGGPIRNETGGGDNRLSQGGDPECATGRVELNLALVRRDDNRQTALQTGGAVGDAGVGPGDRDVKGRARGRRQRVAG